MIQKLKQTLGLCRIERSTDAALSDLQLIRRDLHGLRELLKSPAQNELSFDGIPVLSAEVVRPVVKNIPDHVAETARWLISSKGYSREEAAKALSISERWMRRKGILIGGQDASV